MIHFNALILYSNSMKVLAFLGHPAFQQNIKKGLLPWGLVVILNFITVITVSLLFKQHLPPPHLRLTEDDYSTANADPVFSAFPRRYKSIAV
jgi:hypothetical protein